MPEATNQKPINHERHPQGKQFTVVVYSVQNSSVQCSAIQSSRGHCTAVQTVQAVQYAERFSEAVQQCSAVQLRG